ncbi:MAG: DNA-binding protein [Sulfurimonas sp. RIFOXYB2_FULL_37_5]|uniref:ORF6N domain-containing protein n=1 Tax=unclassified Sulfurimonas TaxID=2623549 RepID=UPI0008CE4CE9|nr:MULTISPECIES: ORF6N domain-containing protein [unclassified Sulfurimonas]MDD3854258.1 ORF6N domain-containing protein [Sulfurimonas sp.]OHE04529.1 MAG: DNA-binding protein [Sulfurimonas sp. RIFOXYB12_FULL_35_9]OHE14371.1 MAG: DNA-binding protein [Sulfurimonas sp. RIFOXYB2_FULL_37_5]
MDKLETVNKQNLQDKIHTIRGFQVMLDRDLAELYGVKPIRLREQVKRNIERFPNDFMFQLSENEVDSMVSQNAIPSKQHLGGSLPLVFTEQGVATLSSVLTSKMAVEIHIQIMRAFVNMRKFISNNALIFQRLDSLEQKQFRTDEKINVVLNALENKTKKPDEGIFFDGQIYDAYAFVNDLLKSAKSEVVLIDNYIDDTVFTLFSKYTNLKIKIYTGSISKQLSLDFQKYNSQYKNIELKEFKNAHDRFMIIDNKEMYHIGASLKDLGKKWFAFSKFEMEALDILGRLK